MNHNTFSRTLSDVSSGDGSLGRTLLDVSQNSAFTSLILPKGRLNSKTPNRTPVHNVSTPRKPSDGTETGPKKTPNSSIKVINNQHECEGDRYIPNRSSSDLVRAQYSLKAPGHLQADSDADYHRAVSESLTSNESSRTRVLRFTAGIRDLGQRTFTTEAVTPTRKEQKYRSIPQMPEKVLDAPEIIDDFYLNILDWSASNILAIALNDEVYLWNATSGDIVCLMNVGIEGEYVTSLRWSPDVPSVIAVGLSTGSVQLWDTSSQSLIRTMHLGGISSAGRVPAVIWRDHLITSGSRSGHIRHHDTRIAHHEVGVGDFHSQEVCGLAWSSDKRFLASGANDNFVAIWSADSTSQLSGATPTQTLREHQAAVKALSWCPWKPNLLCTGGGTIDHSLRFWNVSNGTCIKSVDVIAQVSGIIWNSEYREILTSHGGPKNQLTIWKYPEIAEVTNLIEHQGRILCTAASPNGEMVASCASDETLRIWHCFKVDETRKRLQSKAQKQSVYTRGGIR